MKIFACTFRKINQGNFLHCKLNLICCSLLFLFCLCENPVSTSDRLYPDFINEQINTLLVDYLENDSTVRDGVKSFVFFQYYKLVKDGDDYFHVMFHMYETCIMIRYQQVFDITMYYRPYLYIADIRKRDNTFLIEKMVSAPLFILTVDTLKALFPDDVYQKIISKEKDSYFDKNRQMIGIRITDYCNKTLTDDRFVYIDSPNEKADVHMHTPDMYTLLNLKACYEYTSITEIKDTIVDTPLTQITYISSSPDGRYQLFYVSGRSLTFNYEYFYRDNQSGKTFEIKNNATDELEDFTWRGDSILAFDQYNGTYNFDRPYSPYGVHFEIDIIKCKVIWAAPFGKFSFAKNIEK